ncbi:MAG TPA: aspartate aminotransferase family protein [Chitinophagales bacterium]|nr:aspartate aminotransferase family protein [Chitinophagales bacterium]
MGIITTTRKEESGFEIFKKKKKTDEIFERRKRLVPNALTIIHPSTVSEAKGAIITDADGNPLIDFAGGIGVLNAGHCPPKVVKAIQEQAAKFIHTCFGVSAYEIYLDLAEKLIGLFPHGEATKVMLTNSGAESVENAIKIARQATGRPAIICYTGAFHGRTLMATTLTSKVGYKMGVGPFAPEVYRAEFPDYAHDANGRSEDEFADHHLKKLNEFFHYYVPEKNVAAIIIECVQGEGGFNVVPKKYLQGLRKVCDENGIMLVIDEVQTGFCRTGKWAAHHNFDITTDISTYAKSMASGMPIGAVIGKQSVMDGINPGTIGGTFLGNPVCCAAAVATIDYMTEIDLNEKGKRVGEIVRSRFEELKKKFPQHITDVRGLGAMMAFELSHDGEIQKPNEELAKKLIQRCYENGLIIISAGVNANIIRVLSPLVIEEEDLMRGLYIIEDSLKELTK